VIRGLIVGHAESAWMPRLRFAAKWLGLGLLLGAITDLIVRCVA
jgi:hypothetical protein